MLRAERRSREKEIGRTGGTEELLELLSSPWYEQCRAEGEEGEEAMEERRKREARRGRKNKRRREGRGVGGRERSISTIHIGCVSV